MTIIAAFCPLSLQTLFDANARPIKGGNVYTYDAQTTNPRTVYRDPNLASAHTFPIKTDAYGRIPPIYVGVGPYKVVLKDASNGLISAVDQLPGGTDTSATVTPVGTTIGTGMIMGAHTDDLFDGWLPLNAKTIGNANSNATARANDDANPLFVKLWNKDATLPVSGGRGISASADWAAAKTIALPDYRGRFFVGVDGMGAPNVAGNITTFTTPDPDMLGTTFGAESEVLTVNQLPEFTPAVTITAAGGFTPTGTMDQQGNHTHTGSTDNGGSHSHSIESVAATAQAGGTCRGIFGGGATDQGTDPNGVHQHTFTTGSAGVHTHNITMNAQPDHTHTATAASIGAGAAHSKIPPAISGYWHIKL